MPASVSSPRVGVRLIGARGSVATTVEGEVHIDDVPALGDGKTAWDPLAFDGCLGIRTVLQTIWQGCASSLAAPPVPDLARFTARAHEVGPPEPLTEPGFSFKDPMGGGPAAPEERHAALVGFARRAATPRTGAASGDITGGGGAGTDGRTEARPGDRPGEGAVRTERPGEER